MSELGVPRLDARARRGLALIGLAAAVLVAAGTAYLRPHPASLPAPGPAPPLPGYQLAFTDPDQGAAVVRSPADHRASLFLTGDGGRTWRRAQVGPPTTADGRLQLIDGSHAAWTDLGAGGVLWTSVDGGLRWRAHGLPAPAGGPLPVAPVFTDPLHGLLVPAVAGADPDLVWRTSDGGASWQGLNATGLPYDGLRRLGPFSSREDGLLAASPASGEWPRLLATADGGVTWRPSPIPGPPAPGARAAEFDVLRLGGRLVFWAAVPPPAEARGTGGPTQLLYHSISEDGGLTWGGLVTGPEVVAVSPGGPGAAPVLDDSERLLVLARDRLWSTSGPARSWAGLPLRTPPGTRALRLLAAVPGAIFALGIDQQRAPLLLRSRDGGASWEAARLPRP